MSKKCTNLSAQEIFFNYVEEYFWMINQVAKEREPISRGDFLTCVNFFNNKIGILGESIARLYLEKRGFKVFKIGCGLFEKGDVIPEHLIFSPEIEEYVKIDKYIHDYYNAYHGYRRQRDNKEKSILSAKEAKLLNLYKNKNWTGHPGRIDFFAYKENSQSLFFEVKTNGAVLNKWQKIRLLWLSSRNISAQVFRIRLEFSPLKSGEAFENKLVKVFMENKPVIGLIKRKSEHLAGECFIKNKTSLSDYYKGQGIEIDPQEEVYFIKLPEASHLLCYPTTHIEIMDYDVDLESVQEKKSDLPSEKEIKEITNLVKSYYHQEYGRDYGDELARRFFKRERILR